MWIKVPFVCLNAWLQSPSDTKGDWLDVIFLAYLFYELILSLVMAVGRLEHLEFSTPGSCTSSAFLCQIDEQWRFLTE